MALWQQLHSTEMDLLYLNRRILPICVVYVETLLRVLKSKSKTEAPVGATNENCGGSRHDSVTVDGSHLNLSTHVYAKNERYDLALKCYLTRCLAIHSL